MRSIEDQMAEISRRKDSIKEKRKIFRMSLSAVGMSLILIVLLIVAPGIEGNIGKRSNPYLGSMIFGPEAGGYVIVALIAFSLGVLVTLIILKKREFFKNT